MAIINTIVNSILLGLKLIINLPSGYLIEEDSINYITEEDSTNILIEE